MYVADSVGATMFFRWWTGEDPYTLQKLNNSQRLLSLAAGALQFAGTVAGAFDTIAFLKSPCSSVFGRMLEFSCFTAGTQVIVGVEETEASLDTATGGDAFGQTMQMVLGGTLMVVGAAVATKRKKNSNDPWEDYDPSHEWEVMFEEAPSEQEDWDGLESAELDEICDLLFHGSPKQDDRQ